jgi:hypothetical protein
MLDESPPTCRKSGDGSLVFPLGVWSRTFGEGHFERSIGV